MSLGSYFQANPQCHHVKLDRNRLQLHCLGHLQIQEIFDINIFDHHTNYCSTNIDWFRYLMDKSEENEFQKEINANTKCNTESFFKLKQFQQNIEEDCLGKHKCNYNKKMHSYMNESHDCFQHIYHMEMIIQFKCGNKVNIIEQRNRSGIICSCLGVVGNLFYIIGITYRLP